MDAHHKILLLVDQPTLKETLSKGLDGFHYHFLAASQNVIQEVFDEMPHLIVIDEDFDHGAGRKLAAQIKEDLILKFIPVILLTNYEPPDTKKADVHIELYFSKTGGLESLVHRMDQTLEENYNELDLNPLTNLPGSRSSVLRIERAIRAKKLFAVCCVDLSDLDAFNSAYGDAHGDEVIIHLSKIIQEALKTHGSSDDFLGHLGGDNFIIVTSYDLAVKISESIIYDFDTEIHKFYSPDDRKHGYILRRNSEGFLTHTPIMNVSVVIVHDDHNPLGEISEIGRVAGSLKKYTKAFPESCYIKYRHHPEEEDRIKIGETLEVQFPNKMKSVRLTAPSQEPDKYSVFFNAILNDHKIETVYQPIVDMNARRIHGYEALTRSRADDFTTEPALLFSIARESGKIKELDKLCVEVALTSAQNLELNRKLFINLSFETLIDPVVMKEIFSKKNVIGFHNIVIELTEHSILRSFEKVRDALFELKEQGVSVAIDDVGGGAVSLRDVAVLKPNYIKFDRSLIRMIDSNSIKQQIVLSMILFANGIHAITTAEGIETKEEFYTVQSLGVSLAQGYYFAEPGKPFPKVEDFL